MEKLGLKIPLLVFFLAVIYYTSTGLDPIDSVIKSFMLAFGVALIILMLTLVLVFILTLQKNRSDDPQAPAPATDGKKVEVQV